MTVLSFENVSYSYSKNGKKAIQNINFQVQKGELIAVVGKNGAGKTTLLKHINGLLHPTSGIIRVKGEDIREEKLSKMATIVGFAFQNPDHQLFAESVKKELIFGPKNLGRTGEECQQLLQKMAKQFNISHLLHRNPITLSGGEKRLVSIASVLTMNQELLVLDEPTFGQDYQQKQRLGRYFRALTEKGLTIILVSHDLDFIADFVPRILVLADGHLIADGSTKEIFMDKKLLIKADLVEPVLLELSQTLQKHLPSFHPSFLMEEVKDELERIYMKKSDKKSENPKKRGGNH
ncbi:ABC transporter ATP-binding protein [Candidatus Heimdallarchaeota archaeon]|jgi:energy-coupling factor transport system ATP-binding protein|nr:MAG: ABC transporter ATP-binding protein [Candidatus Heimdallarchaeota archaeon]